MCKLQEFIEVAGEEANIIQFFTHGIPKSDASFQHMTFAGKIAVAKTLRLLLKNKVGKGLEV